MASLLKASYRGVPILVRDPIVTEEGRDWTQFEYPNSDKRDQQDQGYIQPKYTVTIVITGDTQDQYNDNLENIRRALLDPKPATFIHPVRGAKLVKPLPFTLTENLNSSYLKSDMAITFIELSDTTLQTQAAVSPTALQAKISTNIKAAQTSFSNKFPTVPSTTTGISRLINTLTNFISQLKINSSTLGVLTDVKSVENVYNAGMLDAINDGSIYFSNVSQTFQNLYDTEDDPEIIHNFFVFYFDYSDTVTEFALNRVFDRIKEAMFNQYVKCVAFMFVCSNCIDRAYLTSDEIDADLLLLTIQLNKLLLTTSHTGYAIELRQAYLTCITFLLDLKVDTFSDVTLSLKSKVSVVDVCYSAYGTLYNLQDVEEINETVNFDQGIYELPAIKLLEVDDVSNG